MMMKRMRRLAEPATFLATGSAAIAGAAVGGLASRSEAATTGSE